MSSSATLLTRIVADKTLWLENRRRQQPLNEFQSHITPSQRNFYAALQEDKIHFILECKKASPSKGLIRNDFNPRAIANAYRPYASVISVLTDEKYFQGDFSYLQQVSGESHQPLLCKDFIIDAYQIYLARYHQADAVLLMLSVLDDAQYRHLSEVAHSLKMGVLTEVSNEAERLRAIALNAKVVGINNRDLRDLSVDLSRTPQLATGFAADVRIISESGIHHHQHVRQLSPFAHGFLVGSALMSQPDLETAIRSLLFSKIKICGLTRTEDANAAYLAGALYGGLIFVESSPRFIEPAQARNIMAGAPLKWVGVFRNTAIEKICAIAETLGLFAIQLHGAEDENYLAALRQQLPQKCQIWRALSVSDLPPVLSLPHVDVYLLDNGQGGSGQAFDWSLIKALDLHNVMLAGGLNANNSAEAAQLGCMGLDFNSGVETKAGIKDPQRIKTVFTRLRTHSHAAPVK